MTDASSVGASDGAVDLTVTGGTAPYSFSWSNGATTEDISGLNAGTYSVTITDANGCTTSASATVNENAAPINTSTVVTNVTCNGDADGAINLTVTGGTPPYSFSWSNGDATEDISGLSAGTYNVTITDNDGTTANASATVSEPSALNTATNVTDASSVGASDGAVDLTVTGGTAPYSFSWSNGATTEDISGLNAGTDITITDGNGCTTSASATVNENASAINTSTAVTNVTCNGDADGAINLTVTGGTPPYSFSWSNGDATEDISGLSAGTYNVTITDNDGTTANASATVSEPSALNTATNVTDASSVGASDGAIDLTVTGGTAPYSFSWSNGATTEDISGLNAGTYNVTITDGNGCTTSASATVSENASR
ncbi:MAG: SprB repeat-containing protein [Bacteroidales bacterium]|nr:SprB repeat-containing protein [Bacteroidales bacterium]